MKGAGGSTLCRPGEKKTRGERKTSWLISIRCKYIQQSGNESDVNTRAIAG